MPVMIELSISDDAISMAIPDEQSFQLWADSSCLTDDDVVASMQVVGRNEMQRLNSTYRGKDKPTNVLSFPMKLPEEVDIKLLGDLAFCADVIDEEARQQSKTPAAHWAHMVVHGMLHLQGYDHIESKDAEEMEALEIRILDKLGFQNPYA